MILSRALILLGGLLPLVQAQDCPSNDTGQCDFEPFNPYICGAPDYNCGYENSCLAQAAGYDISGQCCQAPQPSNCVLLFDPQVCGSKACPYDNLCIADLAGYSESQCTPAPPPCPSNDTGQCSGDPANPVKCGAGKTCKYENYCLAEAAGFDPVGTDCCQDSRPANCPRNFDPVSCGPPEKQCPYNNQCMANAAGYQSRQCCKAVPDEVACTLDERPVVCGAPDQQCQYANQCLATAVGYTPAQCCAQPVGACTTDNSPVACGLGPNKCNYPSESCAAAAGYNSEQCCKQPQELGACPFNIDPVACGSLNCRYDNRCIAELAGFDPNSCVSLPPINVSSENGDTSQGTVFSSAGAVLFSFLAWF